MWMDAMHGGGNEFRNNNSLMKLKLKGIGVMVMLVFTVFILVLPLVLPPLPPPPIILLFLPLLIFSVLLFLAFSPALQVHPNFDHSSAAVSCF